MVDIDLSKYNMLLDQSYEKRLGKVTKVVGLTIESIGLRQNSMICAILLQRIQIRLLMPRWWVSGTTGYF